MKLNVITGDGVAQTIIVNGVAETTDLSTHIAEAGAPQLLIPANVDRGGYLIQNLTDGPLLISTGEETDPVNSFQIQPLGFWPPAGYPLTLLDVWVQSDTLGAVVVAREW